MNNNFLHNVLLEVSIDDRVPSGMIDITNILHLEILTEKLMDHGIDSRTIMEVVNKLAIRDGKYPDRQAYNKDGWLVTFPTPEHKNAAIKKKTAFTSDPTNGRGGMHLYYKSKGKQSRQKSQGSSEVGGEDGRKTTSIQPKSGEVSNEEPTQQPVASELPKSGESSTPTTSQPTNDKNPPSTPVDATKTSSDDNVELTKSNPVKSDTPDSNDTPTAKSPAESTPSAPKQTDRPIVKLSVEFARSKSWRDAPYGDWTNDKGEQIAVTGMDGQVVPIRFVDREELKSFAEKRMSDGLNLHEEFQRLRRK